MLLNFKKSLLLTFLSITLLGSIYWRWHSNRYPSWQEEVELSDGRIITVTQERKYYEYYGTDQTWIEFSLPETNGKQIWASHLMPMRLDIWEGKVYAFGLTRGPKQAAYYRYPKYMIAAFQWDKGEFKRIPFLQVPKNIRNEENIYRCLPPTSKKSITLTDKNATWCPPDGDKGQFIKIIDLKAYEAGGEILARLSGGPALTD